MTPGRAPATAGFTLLELLVALSVMGLILVLLTQGVQFGLQVTRTQAAVRDRHADLETIDRTLRRLIASADPGTYPEPSTLRGTASALSFTTELPGADPGRTERADVALAVSAGQLVLRWTPRRHVDPFGAPPAWQQTTVLDGVEQVEFAYRAAGPWLQAWSAEKLPSLIRIAVRFPARDGRRWPPIVAAPVREALEE